MLYKNQARLALQSPLLPTLGVQKAIRLSAAKISAGDVLDGHQPTRVSCQYRFSLAGRFAEVF